MAAVYINAVWLPRTDIYKPEGEFARRVDETCGPEMHFVVYNTEPPRLLIDFTRPVTFFKNDPEQLRTYGREHGTPFVIFTSEYCRMEIEPLLQIEELDRTPSARWPGDLTSQPVAYRVIGTK